ncbi:MAG: hypothetical protein QOG80_2259, partial [Pseudonocardiales bacterium]|nr:hypothetical protein [Pseudonocardiales bacterium]
MPAFRSSIAHATQHSSLPAGPGANGGPTDVEAHYAAVCAVLWSERELLESLACTAIVDQLMTHAAAARGGSDTVRRE